jgi:hypothetical protein
MRPLVLIVTALWATFATSTSNVVSRQVLDSCRAPLLSTITCAAGLPASLTTPRSTLPCRFTLSATVSGVTKFLAFYRYPEHPSAEVIVKVTFQTTQAGPGSPKPVVFSLEEGEVETVNNGIPYEYLLIDAGPEPGVSFRSVKLGTGFVLDKDRTAYPGRVKFKCIDGVPRLVLLPPDGSVHCATCYLPGMLVADTFAQSFFLQTRRIGRMSAAGRPSLRR